MIKLSLFLILGIVSSLVLFSNNMIYGQQPENITSSNEPINFIAIQYAQSGSITEINVNFTLSANMELNNTILTGDKSKLYQLVLNNVSDKTILFSDRPERIVKTESTTHFIGNWSSGVDSFAIDSPNAVLVMDDVEQDTVIIELFNPVYDINKKTLKYEATQENATYIDLPNEFGQTTLIIDDERVQVLDKLRPFK